MIRGTRRQVLASGAVVGTTALAGCSGILSSNGEFAFEDVAFSEDQPTDVGEYTEVTTFDAGDIVWFYVEVVDAPTDDDGTVDLQYEFELEDPDGNPWDGLEREERWEDAEGDLLAIWEQFPSSPEDDPGEYELVLTVHDQIQGEQLSTTETFTLE